MRAPLATPLLVLAVAAGCAGETSGEGPPDGDATPPPAAEAPDEPAEPAIATAFGETLATNLGLAIPVPEGWSVEEPASSMRLAQLGVPGAGGAGEGQVVVYYFGPGQGGGVEANLDRWRGQLEQTEAETAATRIDRFDSAVGPVTLLDAAGTYVAETRPGSGRRLDEPDTRMLAAVVETERGAVFFKGVGPEPTMAAARDELRAMIDALGF